MNNLLGLVLPRHPIAPFLITFDFEFADAYGQGPPQFTMNVRGRTTAAAIRRDPSLGFGEGYMRGDITISSECDLAEVIRTLYSCSFTLGARLRALPSVLKWAAIQYLRANTPYRARRHIAAHYDLPFELYHGMLDSRLVYSCGYFMRDDMSLDAAQLKKLDVVAAKLELLPNDTLLDIGCGFGAMLFRAAEHGARVYGLTLSDVQYRYVVEEIQRRGLTGRVTVAKADWRNLPASFPKTFSKVVTIGMFEHVGRRCSQEFLDQCYNRLAPRGLLLLHTIARHHPSVVDSFTQKYIFPGSEIPIDWNVLRWTKRAGFDLRHVEYLGTSYALTLAAWRRNFLSSWERIKPHLPSNLKPEQFRRMWELYLAAAEAFFYVDSIDLVQVLASKGCPAVRPNVADYSQAERVADPIT